MATLTACQESMVQRAARDAREMTEKKCPMPLDAEGKVILERIDFDTATLTWQQHYLLNMQPEDGPIDQEEARHLLLDELKNSPSYQPYMDNGFVFQYIYCRTSNPTDTLINLSLTPQDYKD